MSGEEVQILDTDSSADPEKTHWEIGVILVRYTTLSSISAALLTHKPSSDSVSIGQVLQFDKPHVTVSLSVDA